MTVPMAVLLLSLSTLVGAQIRTGYLSGCGSPLYFEEHWSRVGMNCPAGSVMTKMSFTQCGCNGQYTWCTNETLHCTDRVLSGTMVKHHNPISAPVHRKMTSSRHVSLRRDG